MKAHAEEYVLKGSLKIEDFLGNALADAAADAKAASQVDHFRGKEIENNEGIAF